MKTVRYYAELKHANSGERYAVQEDASYQIIGVHGPLSAPAPKDLSALGYDTGDAEWANAQKWELLRRMDAQPDQPVYLRFNGAKGGCALNGGTAPGACFAYPMPGPGFERRGEALSSKLSSLLLDYHEDGCDCPIVLLTGDVVCTLGEVVVLDPRTISVIGIATVIPQGVRFKWF